MGKKSRKEVKKLDWLGYGEGDWEGFNKRNWMVKREKRIKEEEGEGMRRIGRRI